MSLYEQISGKRKMEFVPFFGPHKAQILILSKMCGKFYKNQSSNSIVRSAPPKHNRSTAGCLKVVQLAKTVGLELLDLITGLDAMCLKELFAGDCALVVTNDA
jgi:hypothetical protein